MAEKLNRPLLKCSACGTTMLADARFCGSCGFERVKPVPLIGQVIAQRYRILEPLGAGGMGSVYRAEHVQMGKSMAIKLLHSELERDPGTLQRFQREAEAASKLSHPNTVQVFDFGRSEGGLMYLAMEHVHGRDLGEIIEEDGPLTFARAAVLMAQVASSVQHAHDQGIIHRDIKPENIMVTDGPDGEIAKVLDFGLAKLREGPSASSLTRTGSIVGTPYYMAPEQIQGERVDQRTDVYALGAVLYMAVVGQPPFDADNPVGILTKHLTQPVPHPSATAPQPVPDDVDAIVLRAMQKKPDARYQSASEFRNDLLAYLTKTGRSISEAERSLGLARSGTRSIPVMRLRRPRYLRWLAALAVLLALAGAAFFFATPPSPERREIEPNHEEANATLLPEGQIIYARLGRRLDETSGDVDIFDIRMRGEELAPVEIQLSAIPNMDVVLELWHEGAATPAVVVDVGGVGEGEFLPNYPLGPGRHLLRVRERRDPQELPTENVSDDYTISWRRGSFDEGFEREPNDSLEQAERIGMGEMRRAWLGWPGDVDTFCLMAEGARVRAFVSAIEGVDVFMRIVDRKTDRSLKVDSNRAGRGETSRIVRHREPGSTCIEIGIDPNDKTSLQAAGRRAYAVEFRDASKR